MLGKLLSFDSSSLNRSPLTDILVLSSRASEYLIVLEKTTTQTVTIRARVEPKNNHK